MTSDSGQRTIEPDGVKGGVFCRSREPLVTREILEFVIKKRAVGDDSFSSAQQDYLRTRWVSMVMWWHDRSTDAKRRYHSFRLIIIIGGVAIPVLAAAGMTPGWGRCAAIATAIVGAIVAAAAAWEGVANYGETWREKRRAAELLKVEGWLFLTKCGKYGVRLQQTWPSQSLSEKSRK